LYLDKAGKQAGRQKKRPADRILVAGTDASESATACQLDPTRF